MYNTCISITKVSIRGILWVIRSLFGTKTGGKYTDLTVFQEKKPQINSELWKYHGLLEYTDGKLQNYGEISGGLFFIFIFREGMNRYEHDFFCIRTIIYLVVVKNIARTKILGLGASIDPFPELT